MANEWKKWNSNENSLDPRGKPIITTLNHLTYHWIVQIGVWQGLDKDETE